MGFDILYVIKIHELVKGGKGVSNKMKFNLALNILKRTNGGFFQINATTFYYSAPCTACYNLRHIVMMMMMLIVMTFVIQILQFKTHYFFVIAQCSGITLEQKSKLTNKGSNALTCSCFVI